MNGKKTALTAVMLMVATALVFIPLDDGADASATAYPVEGEVVTVDDLPESMAVAVDEELERMNKVLVRFDVKQLIGSDDPVKVLMVNKVPGSEVLSGKAVVMAFDSDGRQYTFDGLTSPMVFDGVDTSDKTIDTCLTGNQVSEGLVGGCVYLAFGTTSIESLDITMKVVAGTTDISPDIDVHHDISDTVSGRIVPVSDVPEDLAPMVTDGKSYFAMEYVLDKALESNLPVYIDVASDRTITGSYHMMAYDKDGEMLNDQVITKTVTVDTLVDRIDTGLTANQVLVSENIGMRMYVLFEFTEVDPFQMTVDIIVDDGHVHAVSNRLVYTLPQSVQYEDDVNGIPLITTTYTVPTGNDVASFDVGGPIVTIDNTGSTNPVTTFSYIQEGYGITILNEAMTGTMMDIDIGEAKRQMFVFDISYTGESTVTIQIPSDTLHVTKGQVMKIVALDENGDILQDDTTITDDGTVTLHHASTYIAYVYQGHDDSSLTIMAVGAGVAIICIIIAVIVGYMLSRKH